MLRIIVFSSAGLVVLIIVLICCICCLKKRADKARNEKDEVMQHDSTEESVNKYKMKHAIKDKVSQLRYKKTH